MADGYRVEVSANNRAGCQDALCKTEKSKILKGQIRFGVFVSGSANGHDFSGFKWRHWGCVSGKTLENIRTQLQKYGNGTDFNWDYLDGLEEMPPAYREKIKAAITEGKIADEDWNGDPDYNVLGKLGIRARGSARKNRSAEEKDQENTEVETPSKPSTKKRGRTMQDGVDDEEEEEGTPAKKRATNVKRGKEDEEQKVETAEKGATKVKEEDVGEDEDPKPKPARKPRAKKGTKTEQGAGLIEEEDVVDDPEPKLARKPRAKKGVKNEQDADLIGKGNEIDAKTKPARRGRARAVKEEDSDDTSDFVGGKNNAVKMADKPARKARGKKTINRQHEEAGDTVIQNPLNGEVGKLIEGQPEDEFLTEASDFWEPRYAKTLLGQSTQMHMVDSEDPSDYFAQIAIAVESTHPYLIQERKDMLRAGKTPKNDWTEFLRIKFQKLVDDGELPGDIKTCSFAFVEKLREKELHALENLAEGLAAEAGEEAKPLKPERKARKTVRKRGAAESSTDQDSE